MSLRPSFHQLRRKNGLKDVFHHPYYSTSDSCSFLVPSLVISTHDVNNNATRDGRGLSKEVGVSCRFNSSLLLLTYLSLLSDYN